MKTKKQFIGHILTCPKFVKKEYLSKKKKHTNFIFIEIYTDNRYGAVARIYERNSFFDRIQETITKKERKRILESFKKKDFDKPLDTSKWVRPDTETIRRALVESLFALEILKEDASRRGEYYGKAQAFYSILHHHSPKNPQSLGNWSIDPYFEKIMDELKCPVSKKYWADFNKMFKKKQTKKDWKKSQTEYQEWKKKCLKNMIIPDPKPHRFKDIFKRSKKKVVKK